MPYFGGQYLDFRSVSSSRRDLCCSPSNNVYQWWSLSCSSSISGCGKRYKPKKGSAGAKNHVKANPKTPSHRPIHSQPTNNANNIKARNTNDDSNAQMVSEQGLETTKPLVNKDEKVAKGSIVRRQSDYPAMNDEISDSVIGSHSSYLPKEKNGSAEEEVQTLTQAKKTQAGNSGQEKKEKAKKKSEQ
uniref:Uncharacterized protein n=1 Tax=Ditylenchus dipsaci TaxID=166011 RepID=A0A915EVP1_9BILA